MTARLSNIQQKNNQINTLDRVESLLYTYTILTQKVGGSGGQVICSTGSMNTASIAKGVSSSPPNSERFLRNTMWNDFSSLEVLIRVSLYSRRMNGKNRNQSSNRFRSQTARRDSLTGFIFRAPARLPVIGRGGF